MNLDTFNKSIQVVKDWRLKHGKKDYEWPDPRDPKFQDELAEAPVVAQDIEKSLVALCAWREMRGDLYQGMSSVVHVIHNRQVAGMFRSHLSDDVTGKNQFSSMTVPGDHNLTRYPEGDYNFVKILENIEIILDGKAFDITMGSLYYGVIENVTSGWFMREIVHNPEYERTVQIGRTTFFKPVKKAT